MNVSDPRIIVVVSSDKQAELFAVVAVEITIQHPPADRLRHIDRLGEMADIGFAFGPGEQLHVVAERAEQEALIIDAKRRRLRQRKSVEAPKKQTDIGNIVAPFLAFRCGACPPNAPAY